LICNELSPIQARRAGIGTDWDRLAEI